MSFEGGLFVIVWVGPGSAWRQLEQWTDDLSFCEPEQ